jgi:hypothetical protein
MKNSAPSILIALAASILFPASASDLELVEVKVGSERWNVYVVQDSFTNLEGELTDTPWATSYDKAQSLSNAFRRLEYFPNDGYTPYAFADENFEGIREGESGPRFHYNNTDSTDSPENSLLFFLSFFDYRGDIFHWVLFDSYLLGPNASDTLNSFRPNAFALRNAFNLQSAKIAQGLKYDCTIYDQNNLCVSFAGTRSDGKDFDGTTGALIVAHQPSNQFRWGAYVDQSMGSSASGGLTIKNGKSGYGAFAVWSENTDGSGVRVRAAANVGNVDMESTREAFETAEAGLGRSNIESSGVQLEISKGVAINSTWGARPYVGYRKTTNTRAAYVETDDVTAPLSYSSLKQNVETLSTGVTFAHTEFAKTSMFLTASVDHEVKNRFDRYQATSETIEGIDSIGLNDDKRKTYLAFSLAVNHDFDKTQRLGVTLNHRKQVSSSGSVTSAMVQYSKGF